MSSYPPQTTNSSRNFERERQKQIRERARRIEDIRREKEKANKKWADEQLRNAENEKEKRRIEQEKYEREVKEREKSAREQSELQKVEAERRNQQREIVIRMQQKQKSQLALPPAKQMLALPPAKREDIIRREQEIKSKKLKRLQNLYGEKSREWQKQKMFAAKGIPNAADKARRLESEIQYIVEEANRLK